MTPDQDIQQAQTLARIETLVEEMHGRLFGNGQPGELDKIDGRLDNLESTRSFAKGALYVLYGLVSALASWLGIHIRQHP